MGYYDVISEKPMDYTKFNMKTVGVRDESTHKIEMTQMKIPDETVSSNTLLLERAGSYWNSLLDFRTRRERNRMYYRGDQWGDKVWDPDSCTYMTEEDLIKSHGKVPLKQNQIRQIVKNLIGQFLTDTTKPSVISRKRSEAMVGEMLTNTLQYGLQINRSKDLDTRGFEEFLLSGAFIQKTRYQFVSKYQREDVWVDNVPITQVFFNPNLRDVRGTDIDFIGQFHDMYKKDIVSAFSGGNEETARRIIEIYNDVLDPNEATGAVSPALDSYYADNVDFRNPLEPDKGRVFEIWQKLADWRLRCHDWQKGKYYITSIDNQEMIDAENANRIILGTSQGVAEEDIPLITCEKRYEQFWYVKFLSWQGYVLFEAETPYEHKEHPFSVLLYPLVDGEVWGFVEDILDQQRYINRLVTLLDFIIGASSKGVLLVDEQSISDDFDIDMIADSWTKFNGVIKMNLKKDAHIPQQIATKSTNIGINELLNLQLKFLGDISGVSGAIQGQDGGTKPASMYAQETQNSTLNSKDYFESFNSFRKERNWKVLKTQVQYYEEERQLALSGSLYNDEALVYDPEKAKDIQFEMTMGRSPDSPIYRGIIEDNLKEFVLGGFIDFQTYLENSSLPFADNLLVSVQKKQEQAMSGGGASMIDPGMVDQAGQYLQDQGADATKADPKKLALAEKFMGGAGQVY